MPNSKPIRILVVDDHVESDMEVVGEGGHR